MNSDHGRKWVDDKSNIPNLADTRQTNCGDGGSCFAGFQDLLQNLCALRRSYITVSSLYDTYKRMYDRKCNEMNENRQIINSRLQRRLWCHTVIFETAKETITAVELRATHESIQNLSGQMQLHDFHGRVEIRLNYMGHHTMPQIENRQNSPYASPLSECP